MQVLVTAASKHAATAEIAEAIAEALVERGVDVTVAEPEDVTDLEGIDAVVLGSAVYAGSWLPTATDLVARLRAELVARPVWLFSSGPADEPLRPAPETIKVADILESVAAREHRVFAGRVDRTGLAFAERAIVKMLRIPDGDWRPWEEIRAWAAGIADALAAERAPTS